VNYAEISKETIGFLYQSRASLNKSPLNALIRILVELRVSQINGCAYCCHLHTNEARKLGIQQEKLDILPAWRNSPSAFTDEEKIVLEWVELVTCLDDDLEEIRERLRKIYSERQLVDLTTCVAIMNALNRIVISLRE
jgi:AhpD family alkylhydroperoxidase